MRKGILSVCGLAAAAVTVPVVMTDAFFCHTTKGRTLALQAAASPKRTTIRKRDKSSVTTPSFPKNNKFYDPQQQQPLFLYDGSMGKDQRGDRKDGEDLQWLPILQDNNNKKKDDDDDTQKTDNGNSNQKVNRVLAERIWKWEQESRLQANLPPIQYSIRSGLRSVEAMVQEVLFQQQQQENNSMNNLRDNNENENNTEDWWWIELEQEGLMALLDAMQSFREVEQTTKDSSTTREQKTSSTNEFVAFSQAMVRQRLQAFWAARTNSNSNNSKDSIIRRQQQQQDINLPRAVAQRVHQAKLLRRAWQCEHGTLPSWSQVAQIMGISVARLRSYWNLVHDTTSNSVGANDNETESPPLMTMIRTESTVVVGETTEGVGNLGDGVAYADQDEWELEHGMVLDNGQTVDRNPDMAGLFDNDQYYEGEDQAWIWQKEETGAPLSDIIADNDDNGNPDDEMIFLQPPSSPTIAQENYFSSDDAAFRLMVQSNVNSFLESVLDSKEISVVRQYFGLDDDSNSDNNDTDRSSSDVTLASTAQALQMSTEETTMALQACMRKLRDSYASRYFGDEYDFLGEYDSL